MSTAGTTAGAFGPDFVTGLRAFAQASGVGLKGSVPLFSVPLFSAQVITVMSKIRKTAVLKLLLLLCACKLRSQHVTYTNSQLADLDMKWAIERVQHSTFAFVGRMKSYRELYDIPNADGNNPSTSKLYWGRVEINKVLRNKGKLKLQHIDVLWLEKSPLPPNAISGRASVHVTLEVARGLESLWSMKTEDLYYDTGTGAALVSMLFGCNTLDPLHIRALEILNSQDQRN